MILLITKFTFSKISHLINAVLRLSQLNSIEFSRPFQKQPLKPSLIDLLLNLCNIYLPPGHLIMALFPPVASLSAGECSEHHS